jgi:hypothetical protein
MIDDVQNERLPPQRASASSWTMRYHRPQDAPPVWIPCVAWRRSHAAAARALDTSARRIAE